MGELAEGLVVERSPRQVRRAALARANEPRADASVAIRSAARVRRRWPTSGRKVPGVVALVPAGPFSGASAA